MIKISIFMMSLLTLSCATVGKIEQTGFTNHNSGYAVAFLDQPTRSFLPKSWKIELTKSGQPDIEHNKVLSEKFKSLDGEKVLIKFNRFDLLFNHFYTNGVIAIQSIPLNQLKADKKLSILLKNLAAQFDGEHSVSFDLTNNPRVKFGVSKNWVSNTISFKERSDAGTQYAEAVIEVANSDKLKLDPNHRDKKIKMVLIRPPKDSSWWKIIQYRKAKKHLFTHKVPGLIIASYSMDHPHFDEHLGEFDALVSRIEQIPAKERQIQP